MKKKITFIINSLEGGGTEKHLLQLVKFLKKKYYISIFSFCDGRLKSLFDKEKVKIKVPKDNENSLVCFIKYLFKNDTDCYHFFLPKSYLVGGFLTFFSTKKKIMSRRSLNYYHSKYLNFSLYLEKILHSRMDIILTNSALARKQLILDEKIPEKKVKLIKNLYKIKKQQNIRKLYNLNSKEIVFAIIANLIPYKGHIDLIRASSKIVFKDWKLLIIGENRNNYKATLEKEVKKLELDKNIIFTGFLDNIESYLQDIDFVVNVSEEEGSSNSLLQSIANGLPILVYDIESNKEFVRHNKNGFLVKKGNLSELTRFIEMIFDDKKRKEMSNFSKFLFENLFDYKKSEEKYLQIYRDLID